MSPTNTLHLESNLYTLVGPKLRAMGHQVQSANGEDMGGFQAIWLMPQPTDPAPDGAEQPVAGIYRAASDHRKDGQAAGW